MFILEIYQSLHQVVILYTQSMDILLKFSFLLFFIPKFLKMYLHIVIYEILKS